MSWFKRDEAPRTNGQSNTGNASDTTTRSRQTNVNIVPFRFPWDRRGKVINKQYTDMEVNYDRSDTK
jgi:hypothetical protein